MLSLDNISKSFGARKILADVSWSMADDGRVGLVGLNGAGKSTLLKIIGGVTPPDSGRISLPQRARVGIPAQESPDMGGRSVARRDAVARSPDCRNSISAATSSRKSSRSRRKAPRMTLRWTSMATC